MKPVLSRRELLSLGVSAAVYGCCGPKAWSSTSVATIQRRLRFTAVFSNPLDRTLKDQRFWCYLPANLAPQQQLQSVQVSIPHQILSDTYGHQILALSFDTFPPLAKKVVTIQLTIGLGTLEADYFASPPQDWLAPERLIESDHPSLRALAATLRGASSRDTGRAIYDWVRHNMVYAGYVADDLGALQAYREKLGDCTEYAYLLAALARAEGIPARVVGGYVVEKDAAPTPQDYHNWTQLFFEGNWHLADAQKENWLEPRNRYVVFRLCREDTVIGVGSAHRFRLSGSLEAAF